MTSEPKLIHSHDFRWLWLGQTVSVFGSQLAGLAFPVLAVVILDANEAQMGFLNAADTAAFLLVGLPAGAWVDRWRKRRVMIAADLVRLVATGLIPLLWWLDVLTIWHLVAVGAVVGVATVFFDVGYQSYVPILLPSHHIGPANSALETTNQISRIAGPTIVGALLAIVKAPILILLDAISFGISAITLLRVHDEEQPTPKHERRSLRVEIGEGIQFVWRQKLIRSIAFTTSSTNFFGTIGFTLMPLFLLRDLELSPATYGLMMSVAAVGGLVGAVSTPKLIKWMGEGPLIAWSAVLSGVSIFAMPLSAGLDRTSAIVLLTAGQFIGSFTVLTYNITQVTARQRLCPPNLLGRMNASIRFFIWGVMPLAALLGGALGSTVGIVPSLWIAAVGSVAAAGFVVFSPLSRMRELPSAPVGVDGEAATGDDNA